MPVVAEAEVRAAYEADGFTVIPDAIFPVDVVDRAVAGMDAIRRGESDTGTEVPAVYADSPARLGKIEVPQVYSRAIQDLIAHAALGAWAKAVTGASAVQVWWVQLLYKPSTPAEGFPAATNVGWHQDWSYWRGAWEEGSELFTAWVALSDVDETCGPMRFVRGSHRWGLCDEGDFFAQDIEAVRESVHVPDSGKWEEVPVLVRRGGVSFHHKLTFHGSGPNTSGSPRRSFAIHMRTENSRPAGDRREGLTQYLDDPALNPRWG